MRNTSIDINKTYDEEVFPLGEKIVIPGTAASPGEKHYVFVKQTSSTPLAVGCLAVQNSGGAWNVAPLAAGGTVTTPQHCRGFGIVALTQNKYGFVQCWGPGVVRAGAGAGLTASQLILSVSGTTQAGSVTSAATVPLAGSSPNQTVTAGALGIVLETVSATELASAQIRIP